ncbi:MAG: hypothetical protein ABI910_20635, partial [Gemmatimonadota bacterium]
MTRSRRSRGMFLGAWWQVAGRRSVLAGVLALIVALFGPFSLEAQSSAGRAPVVVASKPFGESYLLAEM